MNQWLTIFQKENLEMRRNFKWLWFPISFVLLGVSEPLSVYYMPQLIDALGGMPEGTVIEIPTPTAPEILYQSISQYDTIGLLIIVLASMGIISAERKSGVAELILVKPVSYFAYISAKWAAALVLVWTSLFLGLIASWYYVMILFETVPMIDLLSTFAIYGLWLSFVLTLTIFFNALFKSPGVVGFTSMATLIVLSIISGSLSQWLDWSPALLSGYSSVVLVSGELPEGSIGAIILTISSIIILLLLSIVIFKKKELA
ncbi:ABC transporter permease [Bacillus sp. DNRA2]|uniref:ABC transporter permease n=1 Tax=Bacillus sp. DNRA2 TaxID=2723053 RepID=UPI00145CF3E3|nr:ABC transporter permease [Bacillus sp. DNRA2]NMD69987.1 ABC transporter permease [Bacillus sp. DNRA2]